MSTLYSDLVYTTFPDEPCDTYEYMQDLNSDLVDLASQYETLINSKKFSEAANLLENNPSLNRIYFNAEKYNKLIDSIRAIQRLYSEDMQTYILELAKYMGSYSNSVKYTKYNVVSYTDSMIYMCVSLDCPLGTIPTDTEYWYPLSIKGEKGVGLGLSYDGLWQANFTYNKDSAVSYGTCLYASTCDDNIGHTPSKTSNDYWELITDFSDLISYDNSSSGLSSTNLQDAIDELLIKTNNNASNISTNTNNITSNTNSINDINSRISNINNTSDENKSVKYAATSGTANYANSAGTASSCTGNSATATNANYATSAGNSDTVDGFHFAVSTTDLTAGSSALTTNMFYFVYE